MSMLSILLQAPAPQGGGMGQMIMLVGVMVIFFFFMIRPQMKRQKEARKFRDGLQKGDSVVTIGGIYAKIVDIKEDNVAIIEIAKDVTVKVDKSALVQDAAALQQEKK